MVYWGGGFLRKYTHFYFPDDSKKGSWVSPECSKTVFWGRKPEDLGGEFSGDYFGLILFDQDGYLNEREFDVHDEVAGFPWQWQNGEKAWKRETDDISTGLKKGMYFADMSGGKRKVKYVFWNDPSTNINREKSATPIRKIELEFDLGEKGKEMKEHGGGGGNENYNIEVKTQ